MGFLAIPSDLLTPSRSYFIISVVLSFFVAGVYFYLLPKPLPGIPYNEEALHSLLGDVPSMMRDERGAMDWLLAQGRRHNGPISQVFLRPFSRPFLLLSDFREAQDIMMRRKEWDRSDWSIDLLSGFAPYHHINQKTGPVWKAHRRLLQDLMLPRFLNDVAAPNMYESCVRLLDLWTIKEVAAEGRCFSVEQDISYFTLDAVLEFSFGDALVHRAIPPQIYYVRSLHQTDLEIQQDDTVAFEIQPVDKIIEATLHASVAMGDLVDAPFPRLSWWIRNKLPREARRIRIRHRYVKQQIEHAVQRLHAQQDPTKTDWVKSAVDLMIRRETINAEKEGRSPVYWSPQMRDEVFGFVIGGHDTTGATMLWGLKFLSDSPRAQSKLRHLLEQAYSTAFAERRMPSACEITHTHVPYLEAVIEEILRLSGSLPILDRQATEDTQVLGHHVPKGTIMMMLNRGPSITEPAFDVLEPIRSETCQRAKSKHGTKEWHPEEMNEFRPERWLTTDSEGRVSFDSTAGPSLPFGLGARGCYGRKLAYLELRIVFTLLIWRFQLNRCPERLSGYEAVETLTHKPKNCYVKIAKIRCDSQECVNGE